MTEKQRHFIERLREEREGASEVIGRIGDVENLSRESAAELIGELTLLPKKTDSKAEEHRRGVFTITRRNNEFYVRSDGKIYRVDPSIPFCECPDFQINRRRRELCKHLVALRNDGVEIAEIEEKPHEKLVMVKQLSPKTIAEITDELVDPVIITEIAKDGLGDGVLYDIRGDQAYIKEDFVAMLARKNNIVSECIENRYEEVKKPDGTVLLLARATAKAIHIPSGASVTRSASVAFDFKRLERETDGAEGRTFADRMAESDACRRAELSLMGIPERILVPMVKRALERYRK